MYKSNNIILGRYMLCQIVMCMIKKILTKFSVFLMEVYYV